MREILLNHNIQETNIFQFITLAYEIISFDKEAVFEFCGALFEMFKMLFNLI